MNASPRPNHVARKRLIGVGVVVAAGVGAGLAISSLIGPATGNDPANTDTNGIVNNGDSPHTRRVFRGVAAGGRLHVTLRTWHVDPQLDAIFQQNMAERLGYQAGAWTILIVDAAVRPDEASGDNNGDAANNDDREDPAPPILVTTLSVVVRPAEEEPDAGRPAPADSKPGPELQSRPPGEVALLDSTQVRLVTEGFSPPAEIPPGRSVRFYLAFRGALSMSHVVSASASLGELGEVELTLADLPFLVAPGLSDGDGAGQ